ncbi:MAG: type II toxin-antitoxin system VapC family toxin [Candidatus Dadabacteria bacterium]|nr:type II toxin-antitoxin system VapC family toxin [Candidatus Dadabacteria bacterium]
MSYLLDTNIVSELRKRDRANPNVVNWFSKRKSSELFLSVLTIGELRQGVERIRMRDSVSAEGLDWWLNRTVREFRDRIINVDRDIAERWGRLGIPDPVPAIDGLIAATALERDLIVVTRNVKHIALTDARYLNPFSAD